MFKHFAIQKEKELWCFPPLYELSITKLIHPLVPGGGWSVRARSPSDAIDMIRTNRPSIFPQPGSDPLLEQRLVLIRGAGSLSPTEMPTSIPNSEKHDPDPEKLRAMLENAGYSARSAAKAIGVPARTLQRYLSPNAIRTGFLAPYPVQFAIEALTKARNHSPAP